MPDLIGPAAGPITQAEALVAEGRVLAAVDLLHTQNRDEPNDDVERYLAILRHAAFAELPRACGHATWPVPTVVDREVAPHIPDLSVEDLSADRIRDAIAAHGSVRVPNLLSADQVRSFVEDIDRVLAARKDAQDAPYRVTSSWFAGLPLPADAAMSLGRNWIAGAGGVLACDSPKVLDRLFAAYAEAGLREVINEYLGERAILSANKCTLRRVPVGSSTDWHQDGAFLGRGVRALNVWIALSDCGRDAPGLDVVPRRFEAVQETGTGGAIFDWAVGPEVVGRLAIDAPVVRPAFSAGDALLFDDLCLHRTAIGPEMTRERYAIESWFFAASDYPPGQVPLVW